MTGNDSNQNSKKNGDKQQSKKERFRQFLISNSRILYMLFLILVVIGFNWMYLRLGDDKKEALDYLKGLSEESPAEEGKLLAEFFKDEKVTRNFEVFKWVTIKLKEDVFESAFDVLSFTGIYGKNQGIDIFAVGKNHKGIVILKRQRNGEWVKESIEKTLISSLSGIWENDQNDVYAVGESTKLHFLPPNESIRPRRFQKGVILTVEKDGRWVEEEIDDKNIPPLTGIWGNNQGDIFAIGGDRAGGIILRFQKQDNGKGEWVKELIRNNNIESLTGIWGNNQGDIFAIGSAESSGIILRRQKQDPGKWEWVKEEIKDKKIEGLTGIWGNNQGDIFTIGSAESSGIILRRQKQDSSKWEWVKDDIKDMEIETLSGIWGHQGEFFVVGKGKEGGNILRGQKHNNGSWEWVKENIEDEKIGDLSGIWGNQDYIFAVERISRNLQGSRKSVILKRGKDKNWKVDYRAKIDWEKLDFEAEITLDVGRLSFFLVAFLTLAVFGYTQLPLEKSITSHDLEIPFEKDISEIGIISGTIQETKNKMESMLKRSYILLTLGIGMALVGGYLFYSLVTPTSEVITLDAFKKMEIHQVILLSLRPTGVLLLVESLSYFFLKQYRALQNDFKYFFNLYINRSDYAAVLKLLKRNDIDNGDKTLLMEKLLSDKNGPTSPDNLDIDDPAIQKIISELLALVKKKS